MLHTEPAQAGRKARENGTVRNGDVAEVEGQGRAAGIGQSPAGPVRVARSVLKTESEVWQQRGKTTAAESATVTERTDGRRTTGERRTERRRPPTTQKSGRAPPHVCCYLSLLCACLCAPPRTKFRTT